MEQLGTSGYITKDAVKHVHIICAGVSTGSILVAEYTYVPLQRPFFPMKKNEGLLRPSPNRKISRRLVGRGMMEAEELGLDRRDRKSADQRVYFLSSFLWSVFYFIFPSFAARMQD